jgi:hypothetical protein
MAGGGEMRLLVGDDWAQDHHDIEVMDEAAPIAESARVTGKYMSRYAAYILFSSARRRLPAPLPDACLVFRSRVVTPCDGV